MQMSDDVRRALQTLRDNAENDFELHWIERLERDLTNPPKVEVIDNKHQSFLGISFRKRSRGHYFNPMMSIYRLVWIYYRGELPPHAVIHHIDENKDNNNIDNLRSMTVQAHIRLHARKDKTDENIFVCQDCGISFSTTANHALYCSACRKKRAQNRQNERKREKTKQKREENFWKDCAQRAEKIVARLRTCSVCGRMFCRNPSHRRGTTDRLTCSDECEQKLRKQRADERRVDRTKICEVCGKPFEWKYQSKQKTCSPECGKILSGRTLAGRQIVKRVISKCEMCGKEIAHLPSKHPRFCSQACLFKYWHKNQTKPEEERVSPKEKRICVVCGKEFECTKTAAKQWCSPECRKKTLEIPCPVCGKMFVPAHPTSTTCSRSCAAIYRHEQHRNK